MVFTLNKKSKLLLIFYIICVIIFIFIWYIKYFVEGLENEIKQVRIPKVIHQIWIGPREPPTKWINKWKYDYTKMYPDFIHVMWNEEKINTELIWTPKLRKIYDEEKEMCGKADIARLLILYQYGGIYIDVDSIWVNDKNLDEINEIAFSRYNLQYTRITNTKC
jgi:mannosyltransferase OCH1-like enzyme